MDEQQVPQSAPVRPVGPIIGIVVAVLLLGGIALVASVKKTPEAVIQQPPGTVEKTQEQVPTSTTESVDPDAVIRRAIDGRDVALCESIPDEAKRSECAMNVVITKANDAKDTTLCEGIANEAYKVACADNIIFVQARDAKNSALCTALTDTTRIAQCKKEASE